MSFAAYANRSGSGGEEKTFWSELSWMIPVKEKKLEFHKNVEFLQFLAILERTSPDHLWCLEGCFRMKCLLLQRHQIAFFCRLLPKIKYPITTKQDWNFQSIAQDYWRMDRIERINNGQNGQNWKVWQIVNIRQNWQHFKVEQHKNWKNWTKLVNNGKKWHNWTKMKINKIGQKEKKIYEIGHFGQHLKVC